MCAGSSDIRPTGLASTLIDALLSFKYYLRGNATAIVSAVLECCVCWTLSCLLQAQRASQRADRCAAGRQVLGWAAGHSCYALTQQERRQ